MKNYFRAFGFNMPCLHLLSVSSSAAIGPLSVNHAPQFLSSERHVHTQTANKTPLCLQCCADRLFTKKWHIVALEEYGHTQLPLVTDYLPHLGMGDVFIWIH